MFNLIHFYLGLFDAFVAIFALLNANEFLVNIWRGGIINLEQSIYRKDLHCETYDIGFLLSGSSSSQQMWILYWISTFPIDFREVKKSISNVELVTIAKSSSFLVNQLAYIRIAYEDEWLMTYTEHCFAHTTFVLSQLIIICRATSLSKFSTQLVISIWFCIIYVWVKWHIFNPRKCVIHVEYGFDSNVALTHQTHTIST